MPWAWGLPDGPWVDRDNDPKLKFVGRKKVEILTEEANAKNWNQSPKKAYFRGHPVIQAVEAKDSCTLLQKNSYFEKSISSQKKSAISINYELRYFGGL